VGFDVVQLMGLKNYRCNAHMACLAGQHAGGVSDVDVIGLKSTWDELFGGSTFAPEQTPAATVGASETDRADSWLDSMSSELTSKCHTAAAAVVDPFDSSTTFDDAFLDGIVGVRRDVDDVWNSLTAGRTDAWSSTAADTSRSRSPFDDVAAFPAPSTSLRTTAVSDERARPRPRPQPAAPATDNPFSAALHAATAAARSAVEGSDCHCISFGLSSSNKLRFCKLTVSILDTIRYDTIYLRALKS